MHLKRDAQLVRFHADPEHAAEAADLVYVTDDRPGITRRRFGKGHAYYTSDGKKVTTLREIERINKLAIPPAYEEVWICPNPHGHLQATGRDDRGRKQYRYHERWAEVRDRGKFANLSEFAKSLPRLRRIVKKHLKMKGLPREKVLAACVRLLDLTYMRVGNAEYAQSNGSFGLTTLQDEHASFPRGAIRLEYTGKHGVERDLEIRDSELAKVVRQCQDLPGQELMQYRDEDGNVRDVGSSDVNDYLREHAGNGFTAKDFRTWHATVLAARQLCGVEPADSKTSINKQVVAAIDAVAETLGNTRAICRKCYVDPRVVKAFEDGKLVSSPPAKAVRGLRQDEVAALALLHASTKR